MGFDASIAHVGGSEKALDLADDRDVPSLNESNNSDAYYRDDSRQAPHNAYAKTEDLRKLQENKNHSASTFTGYPRSDGTPSQNPDATDITVDFSSSRFLTEYKYIAVTNSYTRYLAGEPHIDKSTGKPITVKNLVVLKTSVEGNSVNATGQGEALIFKNGTVVKGLWSKTEYSDKLKLTDTADQEIQLNRGDSWFAALDENRDPKYK
jgi:hypothetical protein